MRANAFTSSLEGLTANRGGGNYKASGQLLIERSNGGFSTG